MSLEDKIEKLNETIQKLILVITEKNNDDSIKKYSGRLIPVPKWNQYHDWPPEAGLRHLIFHEKSNGADVWIKRVGRRVMIDEDKFFSWVRKNKFNKEHPK